MRNAHYCCWIISALSIGFAMQARSQTAPVKAADPIYGLVIHGGAGAPVKKDVSPEDERRYQDKLQEALDAGYAVLQTNGAAAEAVTVAVKVMEDAGLFDAGKGSVFNSEGFCELDAAIMDGRTLSAGAVTGLQHIKNPIILARAVMEKSPHVLLMGEGAEKFAREHSFEMVPNSYFQTERRRKQWERLREKKRNSGQATNPLINDSEMLGTVGCVALDKKGNL